MQPGHRAPRTPSAKQLTPDDHSEVEPPLPIPNRAVKRFSADDSADTCAKVGHCQAPQLRKAPALQRAGAFLLHYPSGAVTQCLVPAISRIGCFGNGLVADVLCRYSPRPANRFFRCERDIGFAGG